MPYVNKTEFAAAINRSPSAVTKMLKKGVLIGSMSDDGKMIDLDSGLKKANQYIKNGKVSLNRVDIERHVESSSPKDTSISTEEAKKQLEKLISDPSIPPITKVQIVSHFWAGRLNRQKYQQLEGELIPVQDAKSAVEALLSPINQYLNDLASTIKNHFPDIPDEITEFIDAENNRQKEQLKNYKWGQ